MLAANVKHVVTTFAPRLTDARNAENSRGTTYKFQTEPLPGAGMVARCAHAAA